MRSVLLAEGFGFGFDFGDAVFALSALLLVG
jgi:hypothetical protein